jgi:hypothetical protein
LGRCAARSVTLRGATGGSRRAGARPGAGSWRQAACAGSGPRQSCPKAVRRVDVAQWSGSPAGLPTEAVGARRSRGRTAVSSANSMTRTLNGSLATAGLRAYSCGTCGPAPVLAKTGCPARPRAPVAAGTARATGATAGRAAATARGQRPRSLRAAPADRPAPGHGRRRSRRTAGRRSPGAAEAAAGPAPARGGCANSARRRPGAARSPRKARACWPGSRRHCSTRPPSGGPHAHGQGSRDGQRPGGSAGLAAAGSPNRGQDSGQECEAAGQGL